jgi:hypothetical protein
VARAGAEGCVVGGGIAFFGFSLSIDDVHQARTCVGDDA